MPEEDLMAKHGGYRKLKSFQMAQLAYDVTVAFCARYVEKRSRTRDQMTQAARSGVQNIAEGSQASVTSKKAELKLTGVARASLEELALDYEDYLRQNRLATWAREHPALEELRRRRPHSLEGFREWVNDEVLHRAAAGSERDRLAGPAGSAGQTGQTGQTGRSGQSFYGSSSGSSESSESSESSLSSQSSPSSRSTPPIAERVANGALLLIGVACFCLDRQIAALGRAFERDGGFTERLYRVRQDRRSQR